MVSIYRVFKPTGYSASCLMGILASRGQWWRGGVRVYCGHFIAKELEAEFFNNLSSVHWLEEQGQVCNLRCLDTLPPRCFTGSGGHRGSTITFSSPRDQVVPTCWAGPSPPSTELHCLQPESVPAHPQTRGRGSHVGQSRSCDESAPQMHGQATPRGQELPVRPGFSLAWLPKPGHCQRKRFHVEKGPSVPKRAIQGCKLQHCVIQPNWKQPK